MLKLICRLFHRKAAMIFYGQCGKPYKICLDCGRAFCYDTDTMKLGAALPPQKYVPFDGTKYGWVRI
jgi:hypothetical protein